MMRDKSKPIYVTQPSLPPLEEFIPYLQQIWESRCLTNNGPFHHDLERALVDYLGVSQVSLFTNGTIALITALQSLHITGEVITTPYSFVATAHALMWNNIEPVFADIDPVSCNLDPDRIEAAITPRTTAILPVHCYGHPCDVERIQAIADAHGLKVIYDAAHAFGVQYKGQSLLRHGGLSVLSFHATKVFNTFEGGAIVSRDAEAKQHIDYLKNFGFADEVTVVLPGINGKMSEFNAALGLLQLDHVAQAIARRRDIDARYRRALASVSGITCLPLPADTVGNYSYFPILVEAGYQSSRDELYRRLKGHGIHARRYFYPLISEMPMYRGLDSARPDNLPNAHYVADRALCLPIYPALLDEDVDAIVALVAEGA